MNAYLVDSQVLILVVALVLFNIVHFIADFTHLNTPTMLAAKRFGKPIEGIALHALIHAVLFFWIGVVINSFFLCTSVERIFDILIIQFVTHLGIDVWKGRMNVWFPSLQSNTNIYHWYVFGFDQLLHQLVIIFCAYLLSH